MQWLLPPRPGFKDLILQLALLLSGATNEISCHFPLVAPKVRPIFPSVGRMPKESKVNLSSTLGAAKDRTDILVQKSASFVASDNLKRDLEKGENREKSGNNISTWISDGGWL